MTHLPDIQKIHADITVIENKFIKEKNLTLSILRLDAIHPIISGNKFFKLYYFLQQSIARKKKIITFGGAYSNHLAATAAACNMYGIKCIGIVCGVAPKIISHTLNFCLEQDMQLEFVTREDYNKKDGNDFKTWLNDKYGDHILIPEGGYSKLGADGAALISNLYPEGFTHICCPVGTATTFAGIVNYPGPKQTVIGFSAIKDLHDYETRMNFLLTTTHKNYILINTYHFGGFAKITPSLISFMNSFYEEFKIPTDIVYTGKMMFGIFDMISNNYFFPEGSNILCIHTGGLQGNLSLRSRTLNF